MASPVLAFALSLNLLYLHDERNQRRGKAEVEKLGIPCSTNDPTYESDH